METITPKRRGRPRKNPLVPVPAVEGADETGVDDSGRELGTEPAGRTEQAEIVIRPTEGVDEFLGRVDLWQAQNIDARVSAATFPGADKQHSNVFNGFMVTNGPAGVTLSTGETIEI